MAGDLSLWLYVEGLSRFVTEDRLKQYFGQWGETKEVGIPKNEYGQILGHAFICFQGQHSVDAVQQWRPHYYDGQQVLTRRMLPPYHARTRTLTVDKADIVLFIDGLSPVSTTDQMYACKAEIWSSFASIPGTVTDVTVNKPVQDMGMWFGQATVYFEDYDSVDLALMVDYLLVGGLRCTLRSRFQQQEHEQRRGLLPLPQVSNNIPVVQSRPALLPRPNVSFGNPNQNLGAARKRVARLRTQTSRPQKEEIDPIRGQIKRKRGATTGSIASAKKQRLTVGLDQKQARGRDGLVHSLLQKVQLVTNGPSMVATLEEELEALSQEQEEKRLKMAALKSVSPAAKETHRETRDIISPSIMIPFRMSPVKCEDIKTEKNDCESPGASSLSGDETLSPLTREKVPVITCQVCDAVVDIHAKPTNPQSERSDVTDTVCTLQQSLHVLIRRKRELSQDLTDLKEALKTAEAGLICGHCSTNQLASIKKCGHGSCKACFKTSLVCRQCLVYGKEDIALVCGPGA